MLAGWAGHIIYSLSSLRVVVELGDHSRVVTSAGVC
jgi:hypothetical protein